MEKLEKYMHKICIVLECFVAILVLIGILLSLAGFFKDFDLFFGLLGDTAEFKRYLERIFTIVIGIEFLKMLCRLDSDNVMEILIFLVARHMIVESTTPFEDFVSVIGVAILCIVRRYLHVAKEKDGGDLP